MFEEITMKRSVIILLFFIAASNCSVINNSSTVDDECNVPADLIQEIQSYQPTVNTIIDSLTKGKHKGKAYELLQIFIDKFGSRLSGTKNLEDATDYVMDLMRKYHLENVHGENATVPHWIRGNESALLLEPRITNIGVLGLGGTVSTPAEGIQAEVLVVRSFEELNQPKLSAAAKGKIIVFNNEYDMSGRLYVYTGKAASEAAKHGGIAALVRSFTPLSLYTIHIGQEFYEDGVEKIPAGSITVEDSKMLQRFKDRGEKIVMKLNLQSETLPDATSRNLVAEIVGSQKPEKVVIVSGHLDSWDVGTGAVDDGGGAFLSWYSLALLNSLGLRAKRTLRVVLFTGNEEGFQGAIQYDKVHKNELDNFTFVMESDEGVFTPFGIEYATGKKGGCVLKEIVKLFASINATYTKYYESVGSDITIWAEQIPTGSLYNDNKNYFWYHHSAADRIEVLDSDTLDKATALWASVAYIIADLKDEFPREFTDFMIQYSDNLAEKLKSLRRINL